MTGLAVARVPGAGLALVGAEEENIMSRSFINGTIAICTASVFLVVGCSSMAPHFEDTSEQSSPITVSHPASTTITTVPITAPIATVTPYCAATPLAVTVSGESLTNVDTTGATADVSSWAPIAQEDGATSAAFVGQAAAGNLLGVVTIFSSGAIESAIQGAGSPVTFSSAANVDSSTPAGQFALALFDSAAEATAADAGAANAGEPAGGDPCQDQWEALLAALGVAAAECLKPWKPACWAALGAVVTASNAFNRCRAANPLPSCSEGQSCKSGTECCDSNNHLLICSSWYTSTPVYINGASGAPWYYDPCPKGKCKGQVWQ